MSPGPARRALALALALAAVAAPARAEEQDAVLPSDPLASADAPWRGSTLALRNGVTARSFDRAADLTYNPTWTLGFDAAARWWLGRVPYLRADFGLVRELTEADDTTRAGETVVGDLLLGVGAFRFWTVPGAGIDLSATLDAQIPTSRVSRARTLRVGLAPGLALGRTFRVLQGLRVVATARVAKYLHRYTTAERESPLVRGCTSTTGACDAFWNTGVRNASWRVSSGLAAGLAFTEWLELSASGAVLVDGLYGRDADDPRVSDTPQPPTNRRHLLAWDVELAGRPTRPLVVALGASTVHPQLAPDSTRERVVFNRYTVVYLDLRLDVAGLVAALSPAPREEAP